MSQGTVKFFDGKKGYGFVLPDGGGNDEFVHLSVLQQCGLSSLDNGSRVEYEVGTNKKGKSSIVDIFLIE